MVTKFKSFIERHPFTIILIGWGLAVLIPLFFRPVDVNRAEKDTLNFYEISFLSVSALFTGIAFAATYLSLKDQKENLNKQIGLLDNQIKIDVFSKAINELRDESFRDCRRYITSPAFKEDVEKIKMLLNKDKISLQDFKDISNEKNIDSPTRDHMTKSYKKILRFCSKIDYLGYLYTMVYPTPNIIVDYYGSTILNTYGKIEQLIELDDNEKEDEGENKIEPYFFFKFLYKYAEQRKKFYYKERVDMVKRFF